jgi:tetratricopeptide (TPR) repeat protein
VPVIGIVQAGSQAIADRYTYVPCIGLTIMLAWGGRDIARRFGGIGTTVAQIAAAAAVAFLAVGAQHQVGYWRDSISIFERSLAVEPGSEALRNNLGNEFYDRGRIDEAIVQYRRILEIQPDSAVVHGNLSNALHKRGEPYEAMRHRLIQRRIDPESAVGQLKLGEVRLAEGMLAHAEIHFRRAVELAPDSAVGRGRLAEALLARGEIDAAIAQFRRAIAIAPDEPAFPRLLEHALQQQRGDGEP